MSCDRTEMGCSSGVVIAPSASTLVPLIRGQPDMVGLLLGSRELLYLSRRISRTLVIFNSLSEFSLPGESVICQIQGKPLGWWSNIILSPRKTGGVFRGSRHVTSTSRHSGADKSSRPLTGTGARHVTSLPPDRGSTHHVVADYQGTLPSLRISVGKFLPSPIQSVPVPSTRFFFLFDYRLRHCAHFDTSPSGVFGRNGFHGESA
jgi:hypothetical protein